jgi:hypothetical protein
LAGGQIKARHGPGATTENRKLRAVPEKSVASET